MRRRSVFENAAGAVFISTDGGLWKTVDDGNTWKRVHSQGMDGNMTEVNGVMMAASMRKLIRSIDEGETWTPVVNEDPVVWDVKEINGGFAALTSASATDKRRLSLSYDGGKNW